jgi:hypothetical protein
VQYSREHFALTLRRTGFPEAAEEAVRVLPDPVDGDQIAAFLAPYGITLDEIVSRMGGASERLAGGWPGGPRASSLAMRRRVSLSGPRPRVWSPAAAGVHRPGVVTDLPAGSGNRSAAGRYLVHGGVEDLPDRGVQLRVELLVGLLLG